MLKKILQYKLLMYIPHCPTSEKDNPFQLSVVKEIVECPQTAWFSKRVTGEIWVVAIYATFWQHHLLVNSSPQRWP